MENDFYFTVNFQYLLETQQKDNLKPGVAALILDKAENVLLLLRKKPPNVNCWTIPGGKVRYNESFQMAIKREVKEEVGVRITLVRGLIIAKPFDYDSRTQWFSPVFLADIKDGTPKNLEPKVHKQLKWFSLLEIPKNINTTTQLALKKYIAHKKIKLQCNNNENH